MISPNVGVTKVKMRVVKEGSLEPGIERWWVVAETIAGM